MKTRKRGKEKGELTSSQIVMLVIVILGFLILLFFWRLIPWNKEIDKDTCHESIILRGSFNKGIIPGAKMVPLKCRTEKICISKGDDCGVSFGKAQKENPITNMKITSRQDAVDIISNALYDCYSMVGEGKLDFMPHKFKDEKSGFICSRIVFSDKAKAYFNENGGDILFMELYSYMLKKESTDKKSYLQDLYKIDSKTRLTNYMTLKFDEWKNAKGIDNQDFSSFKDMTLETWKIDSKNEWAVVSQMSTKGTLEAWGYSLTAGGGTAVALIAGGMILAPITGGGSVVVSLGVVAGLGSGAAVGGMVMAETNPDNQYIFFSPALYPYNATTMQKFKVDDFAFAP